MFGTNMVGIVACSLWFGSGLIQGKVHVSLSVDDDRTTTATRGHESKHGDGTWMLGTRLPREVYVGAGDSETESLVLNKIAKARTKFTGEKHTREFTVYSNNIVQQQYIPKQC